MYIYIYIYIHMYMNRSERYGLVSSGGSTSPSDESGARGGEMKTLRLALFCAN